MYLSIGTLITIVVMASIVGGYITATEEAREQFREEVKTTIATIVIVGATLAALAAMGYGILVYLRLI